MTIYNCIASVQLSTHRNVQTFGRLSIISYSSGTIFGHLSKPCSKFSTRKRLNIGHSLAEELAKTNIFTTELKAWFNLIDTPKRRYWNTGTILIVDDNKGVLASLELTARKLTSAQILHSFESKSDHRPADNAPLSM